MHFSRLALYHLIAFLTLCSGASPTFANVRLPRILADHMVWQRNVPLSVWGWADPGEVVTVQFAGQRGQATTNATGRWSVAFGPLSAGGPHTITVRGKNQITLRDLLVGDVWVCSGQSNMEWAVRDSDGSKTAFDSGRRPAIRLFSTSHQMSTTPLEDLRDGNWFVCSPDSVAGFSAVAWYFGKELHEKLNVPIGLVHSSWGGTAIEPWISAGAIRTVEGFAPIIDQLPSFDLDKEFQEGSRAFGQWKATFSPTDLGLKNGQPIWADPSHPTTDWETMNLPQNWEFNHYQKVDGVVWFRREFTLPAEATQRPATISLGPIDETDQAWVNGQKIGETWSGFTPNRVYTAPANVLRPDRNVLVVRVEDYGGRGGFYGHPEQMMVESGAFRSSLAGAWQCKIGTPDLPPPPRRVGPNSRPTLLYNAMIHPLLPLPIKGAIWYQGESNIGRAAQYRTVFPLLIQDWRTGWQQATGQPNAFPFLFVQIAAYEPVDSLPTASRRAELREAQLLALSVPKTGMVVTIDIGDVQDIHPRNKREVGHRLALAARKVAYGEDLVHSGPIYDKMTVDADKIRVSFREIGSGLRVNGPVLNEFVIAGPDRKFVKAQAQLDGNTVVVWHPDVPNPMAVRYAWANYPAQPNLFNREGLPASPFRTDDWKRE